MGRSLERGPKPEVVDGIHEVRLGAYSAAGIEVKIKRIDGNRLGTEPYAGWCGRTAGVIPPPTRFKVFSAGLYLTKHSNIAEQILSTDDPKSLHIRFLTNLTASKIAEVWEDELLKRCTKNCTSLKEKSKKLGELMIDFKKADSLQFNFFDDHVQVLSGLSKNGVVVGHDFSLALISLWIGDKPLLNTSRKEYLRRSGESVSGRYGK